MLKETHICDRCKKAECPYRTLYARIDRRMDAAGSMENIDEGIDLCPACLRVIMQTMVEQMDYEVAKAWLKLARGW